MSFPNSGLDSGPDPGPDAAGPCRAAVVGVAGLSLGPDEEELLRARPPWGFILFQRNCAHPDQVRALTAGLSFSARDAEQKESLHRRQELVAAAEALDVAADPRAAQAALRDIQNRWAETGRVRWEVVHRPIVTV